ncbi:MAG: diguanylate cyclase [Epulopiscium sp.]|nr:diguanylate cyclase [Candidatus Epulonipiscium sp.]
MKIIQRRFNILATILTIVIIVGLVLQYYNLNKIISNEKLKNITYRRDQLAENINKKITNYSLSINVMENLISTGQLDEEKIRDSMEDLAASNELIEFMYFGDNSGNLIINKDINLPKGYEAKARPWYKEAVEKKDIVISDVYISAVGDAKIVSISKAVYDDSDKFLGVLSLDISIQEIIRAVEDIEMKETGFSFLIDGKKDIIAYSDYKEDIVNNLDNLIFIPNSQIISPKGGQIKVKLDNIKGYLSYTPVENTDWIIGNFISYKDVKGDNKDIWRIFIIVLIISILIFSSFTIFQRRSFLIPLLKLEEDIKNINLEENISYRIPTSEGTPFYSIKSTLNVTLNRTQELFEQVERDKKQILLHNENLNYLSYNDQLTGLYNRRYFEKQLKEVDKDENLPISLIMGDANGLKLINDSFGHNTGDKLLINIASIIKASCRKSDIVFRISGDEFVIILPKTNEEEAKLIIDRIIEASKKEDLQIDNSSSIEMSVSYGCGTKYKIDKDISEVLKEAESKMYSKKLIEGPKVKKRTIETIIEGLYKQNKYNKKHSEAVSSIAVEIGRQLGMDDGKLRELKEIGKVYNIGEVTISNSILDKKDELTKEEWQEIKKHPEIGYRILSTSIELSNLAEYTLAHHERYDGSGYPKGLKGKEIPVVSRIVAVADAYDAMRTDRPYRKALNDEEIIEELRKNAGTQFDPIIVDVFIGKILKKARV